MNAPAQKKSSKKLVDWRCFDYKPHGGHFFTYKTQGAGLMGNTANGFHRNYFAELSNKTSQFIREREPVVVGEAQVDDGSREDYSGIRIAANGFVRVGCDEVNNTLILYGAKMPSLLRGKRGEDDGRMHVTPELLRDCYVISSYRLEEDGRNRRTVEEQIRTDVRKYFDDLDKQCANVFTLYGATYNPRKPAAHDSCDPDLHSQLNPRNILQAVRLSPNYGGHLRHLSSIARFCTACQAPNESPDFPVEIYSTGPNAPAGYVLSRTEERKYKVVFSASTHYKKSRESGPVSLNENGTLKSEFSRVCKVIHEGDDYAAARDALARHWQATSSRLWDQRDLFAGEGLAMQFRRVAANTVNFALDHKGRMGAILAVGVLTACFNPVALLATPVVALGTGIGAAMAHTFMEEGILEFIKALRKKKEALRKKKVTDYAIGENVAPYYQLKTRNNLGRVSPKADMNAVDPDHIILLCAEESGLLRDHEKPVDGLRPESRRGLVLSAHQRGFSSTSMVLDKNTQMFLFQSGLTVLMHMQADGKILLYARDREDVCVAEPGRRDRLRLPPIYRDKFSGIESGRVFCAAYDPRESSFGTAWEIPGDGVAVEEMMDRMRRELFREQPETAGHVREQSLAAIEGAFTIPDEKDCKKELFMGGKPAVPPSMEALL